MTSLQSPCVTNLALLWYFILQISVLHKSCHIYSVSPSFKSFLLWNWYVGLGTVERGVRHSLQHVVCGAHYEWHQAVQVWSVVYASSHGVGSQGTALYSELIKFRSSELNLQTSKEQDVWWITRKESKRLYRERWRNEFSLTLRHSPRLCYVDIDMWYKFLSLLPLTVVLAACVLY